MRILRFVLILSVVTFVGLLIPACGDTAAAGGKIKVAFVSNNIHTFWQYAKAGCKQAEQELGNVEVEFRMPPNPDTESQNKIIRDLKSQGYQAIAVSPKHIQAQKREFAEISKEIPLILVDNDVPGEKPATEDLAARECYLGTDNVAAGRAAGKLLKASCPDGGNFVIFVGSLGAENAKERRKGVLIELAGGEEKCKEQLASLPKEPGEHAPITFGKNYHLLGTIVDNESQDECQRKAKIFLQKHPKDLKAMVGLWEYNPPAMINAVKEEGRSEVVMIGFDENKTTLQTIRDEKYQDVAMKLPGTVVQMPYEFGRLSVHVMVSLVKKDPSILSEDKLNALMAEDKKGFVRGAPHNRFFLRHRTYVKGDRVEEFEKAGLEVFQVDKLQKELDAYLKSVK